MEVEVLSYRTTNTAAQKLIILPFGQFAKKYFRRCRVDCCANYPEVLLSALKLETDSIQANAGVKLYDYDWVPTWSISMFPVSSDLGVEEEQGT
ncbi:hypothetical protein CRM22_003486, partial [Opisthorchis felineus]